MKALPLHAIARLCGGLIVAGDGAASVTNVSTDSRKVQRGDLFVALSGENFDAHDFLAQVAQAGVAGVIVSRVPEQAAEFGCAVIEVKDTLAALQNLAREYRRLHDPLVIGITGSNGKTSTKDFLAAALSSKFSVCATTGNFNNHIGLPLTLLSLGEEHDCAVVEMGTNHPGEIAVLCCIAEPDAAVLTNVGVAHIENFGTREAIALEKGTLAAAVPAGGIVVLNAHDDFATTVRSRCAARTFTAGIGTGDIRATVLECSAAGSRFELNFPGRAASEFFLPVPGEHMIVNAALAAACAWAHGVAPDAIASSLRKAKLTKGRVQVKTLRGVTFLDDSYNANPDSMRAGIRTLSTMPAAGRRIAVLGRMGELGAHAAAGHREVGECAAENGLHAVFTVGEEAALISDTAAAGGCATTRNFATNQECAGFLRGWLREGDAVLLKGSRSAGMEQVLNLLQNA